MEIGVHNADGSSIPANAAIVVDRKGYIVGWNEGAEAVLGFGEKEVIGRACHHVLCGTEPGGEFVCHPWCALSLASREDTEDDDLVLYPHSAGRELLRLVLSVFRIEGDDPTRGWVVHSIISAEPLAAKPLEVAPDLPGWPPPRHANKPKPPDTRHH